MRKNHFVRPLLAFVMVILLTSSFPVSNSKIKEKELIKKEAFDKAFFDLSQYSLDNKLTYTELKDVATTLKGEKLTFKEKLAFRLFSKKISNKAMSAFDPAKSDAEGKSQVLALILCVLVGSLGIHRFYLGYTWQGVVQLLTLGLCGIWTLIDLIRIITGDLKPKNGDYGTTL